jgi:hypothetical protein
MTCQEFLTFDNVQRPSQYPYGIPQNTGQSLRTPNARELIRFSSIPRSSSFANERQDTLSNQCELHAILSEVAKTCDH